MGRLPLFGRLRSGGASGRKGLLEFVSGATHRKRTFADATQYLRLTGDEDPVDPGGFNSQLMQKQAMAGLFAELAVISKAMDGEEVPIF